MSIYTKTGDRGTTALVGGSRVKKSDLRVETYGTLDELNAQLSLAARALTDPDSQILIQQIQYQIFYLSAEVADPLPENAPANRQRIEIEHIQAMEHAIDRCMASLPPVHSFVLPGTSEAGSRLHMARTVTRRAERRLVELAETTAIRPELLQYLNRLSDCLYALARTEDQHALEHYMTHIIVERYQAAMSSDGAASGSSCPAAVLDFPLIQTLVQQAIAAANTVGIPVVIALVDRHGNPILTYRMPDALLVSIDLAPKKAYTAVALKCATHELSASIQPGTDLFQLEASSGGRVVTFGGGYPLYRNGVLIGGFGISGGTVAEDMTVAQAALEGLHLGK